MDKLFELYKKMLELHIKTKTVDLVFHEKSADFYDVLFKLFHTISEKRQDIEEDEPMDCEEAKNEAYNLLRDAKEEIDMMIEDNNSYGMDNLLRGLSDELEGHIGTARGFIKEKEEEDIEDYQPLLPNIE